LNILFFVYILRAGFVFFFRDNHKKYFKIYMCYVRKILLKLKLVFCSKTEISQDTIIKRLNNSTFYTNFTLQLPIVKNYLWVWKNRIVRYRGDIFVLTEISPFYLKCSMESANERIKVYSDTPSSLYWD
jgi:hypothetical protein